MCEFNNDTDCKADKNEHNRWLVNKRMGDIKFKLIVGSNKGGVGKSTVTTNLALALAASGKKVGLADADLHGPNIPKLLNIESVRLRSTDEGIDPYETKSGLKVASLGFLIEDPNMHIAWRDAVKYDFIIELLGNINWGELDYLLFDLPPGTGNEQITIIDFIGEVDGCVVVTTPQDLALLDARKMISFARDSNVPIVGVIENMSTMSCPHCAKDIDVFRKGGGKKLAEELALPYLGSIPLDLDITIQSDTGDPVIESKPDSVAAKAFMTLAENCHKFLNPEESLKSS
ncbi:MAG: Mrp/NBP35 family ATP-binding protein [Candidatus Nitrohelix vancouverensis]|uniref:Iron-sulfur cluster carrier protein n=1 Tax=Candidatus Nitrohelix vancouverensis TaxID=2705534 RepID=A0A7T0C4L0_9BACT|nr:MAG: Mrp/NBP35 family ATP-binding protein [Candidatus Nitrohelix vancouverensis]